MDKIIKELTIKPSKPRKINNKTTKLKKKLNFLNKDEKIKKQKPIVRGPDTQPRKVYEHTELYLEKKKIANKKNNLRSKSIDKFDKVYVKNNEICINTSKSF